MATNIKHNAAQKRAKGKEVDAGEEQWMADSNSSLKQKMLVSLVTLQKRSVEHLAVICAMLSFTELLSFYGSKCIVIFKFEIF